MILWKKQKSNYDPNIESVKYIELIDQDKIWLVLNTALKVCKFSLHTYSHSILNTFHQIPDF